MDIRSSVPALWFTGLFISVLMLAWIAFGAPASEADVQTANSTKTSIAMTASYLLQPRTQTPPPTPTYLIRTSIPRSESTLEVMSSPTSTSLLEQLNTPVSPVAPSATSPPTQTAVAQIPTSAAAVSQDPAEFASWYFARVWNERDYQNLWDNYLTPSYKTNVGSGIFEDYAIWWDSVARVDVNSVDVLRDNGSDAWVRVNVTFHMKDGRLVENQIYDYDFLYDTGRGTWMFDAST